MPSVRVVSRPSHTALAKTRLLRPLTGTGCTTPWFQRRGHARIRQALTYSLDTVQVYGAAQTVGPVYLSQPHQPPPPSPHIADLPSTTTLRVVRRRGARRRGHGRRRRRRGRRRVHRRARRAARRRRRERGRAVAAEDGRAGDRVVREGLVDVDLDAGVRARVCAREAHRRGLRAAAARDLELRALELRTGQWKDGEGEGGRRT